MDKITQVKNHFRLKQWTQLIKDYQSSDMTVKGWLLRGPRKRPHPRSRIATIYFLNEKSR